MHNVLMSLSDEWNVSGYVCGEMAEELSSGGGVSREHGVAELTHLRV